MKFRKNCKRGTRRDGPACCRITFECLEQRLFLSAVSATASSPESIQLAAIPNFATDESANIDINGVFSPDDRTPVSQGDSPTYPYTTIVRVASDFPDGWRYGSGVVIGPRDVLTAGHVLYDATLGGWATETVVVAAADGAPVYSSAFPNSNSSLQPTIEPFAMAMDTHMTVPTAWQDSSDSDYDLGVITLDWNLGNRTGWMGYGYDDNSADFLQDPMTTAGYPGDLDEQNNSLEMFQATGAITKTTANQLQTTQISLAGGQSGSPIWRDGNGVVYGVVSANYPQAESTPNYNAFTRITSGDFTWIQNLVSADGQAARIPVLIPADTAYGTNTAEFGPITESNQSESIALSAEIADAGDASASNVDVEFSAIGQAGNAYPIGQATVAGISSGGTSLATWNGSIDLPIGTYQIEYTADPSNSAGTPWYVPRSATMEGYLTITSAPASNVTAFFEQAPIEKNAAGTRGKATVELSNLGNVMLSGPVTLSLYVSPDSDSTTESTIVTINRKIRIKPQQSVDIRFAFDYPTALLNEGETWSGSLDLSAIANAVPQTLTLAITKFRPTSR